MNPFEALGDPNRRTILELLGDGDRSVQELADALPISRPAVSRHLRLLKEAGLVTDRAEGTRRLYRLHDEGPEAVRAYLEQVWGDAAGALPDRRGEHESERALVHELTVDCPPEHAWAVWAERTSLWWPATHSVSGAPEAVVIEPRPGGRIYERAAGRRGARLGPGAGVGAAAPARLLMAPAPGRRRRDGGRDHVRRRGTGGTAVRIEHRGWERLGSRGPGLRERNVRGWAGLLPAYLSAVTDGAV